MSKTATAPKPKAKAVVSTPPIAKPAGVALPKTLAPLAAALSAAAKKVAKDQKALGVDVSFTGRYFLSPAWTQDNERVIHVAAVPKDGGPLHMRATLRLDGPGGVGDDTFAALLSLCA